MQRLIDALLNRVVAGLIYRYEQSKARWLSAKYGCAIKFVNQGSGGLEIAGNGDFEIHQTSHLKSGTFIECSGGVYIGKYFHAGKGLTIFSSNHNWRTDKSIPYDDESIHRSVRIGDAVWAGANVTIMPGVTVGNGAVIGGGCVLRDDVPPGAVVIGNPGKIVNYRDMDLFHRLYNESKFF